MNDITLLGLSPELAKALGGLVPLDDVSISRETHSRQACAFEVFQPQGVNARFEINHSLLDRYEEALADFNHVLLRDPENAAVLKDRGVCYRRMNQPERAIQDWEKAMSLDESLQEELEPLLSEAGSRLKRKDRRVKRRRSRNKDIPAGFAIFGLGEEPDDSLKEAALRFYCEQTETNPDEISDARVLSGKIPNVNPERALDWLVKKLKATSPRTKKKHVHTIRAGDFILFLAPLFE